MFGEFEMTFTDVIGWSSAVFMASLAICSLAFVVLAINVLIKELQK
jgi:hypothetical protein